MLPFRVRAARRARALFRSPPGRLGFLSWLLSLVSAAITLATYGRLGHSDARADTAEARAQVADDRAAAADARAQAAALAARDARRSEDAFGVVRIASSAELEELRTLATDAVAFLETHRWEDNVCEAHLKPLKAKADQLFAPHAIALRKVEMSIVDSDRLAMAPGLVAAVSRDFKFLCMLTEGRYAALREITWLATHGENVGALLRHLPLITENELLAAEPITDFDSPSFTAKLTSMRQRKE